MLFDFRYSIAVSYQRRPLHRSLISIVLLTILVFAAAGTTTAQTNATVNDGHGKEWMQLQPSVGVTWNQAAQICPQDGVTSCSGTVAGRNFNEWVWATDTQVLRLFSYYEPAMETNRSVGGMQYFFTAQTFLSVFRPTFSFCGTYQCGAHGAGWTSTTDENGLPIFGSVGWGNTNVSIDGGFGVGPTSNPDESSGFRGLWLWRATGPGAFAYDDSGSVPSPNGGVAVANVLANDWIDGVRATTANVSMTQISTTNNGISLDASDGSVDVVAITPAGTYSLIYRICGIANASSCDDATVTVRVNPYVVDAVNDSGWASPSTGGAAVANVLANDRLSGNQATTANVTLSLISVTPANPSVTLDLTDGSVDVAAGSSIGTYSVVYRICDVTDPANCDQATASIVVRNYVIDAVNDYARASSKTASTPIASVLANDTFNGVRATTAAVRISQVTPPVSGITLNTSTGAVSVATRTSSGTYNIQYRICEINAPANCDTATITLELSGRDR